jgi:uncharacterized protein YyaL (SSP411 family)
VPETAKPKPKPLYDESADPKQQIAAALAAAKKNNRRVLIQWGGNWCPWCIRMGELMKSDAKIAHTLLYEYDLVHVNIGQKGVNGDLLDVYGTTAKKDGFPYLTILDADGKVVANQETDSLEVKGNDGKSLGVKAGHDPKKLLAFLESNKAAPLDAQPILDKALADAKSSGKSVFLHFGAPWCGWCHRLEDWMAKPEIAALLAKDFIDAKIDQDRNTGGNDLLTKFRGSDKGGIPWIVFLDSAGKPLADSNAAKGNIGFPSEPAEIEHFAAMLRKAAKNLTAKDIDALLNSLKADKPAAGH